MITLTLNFKTIEAARAALLEIPQSALVGGDDVPAKSEKVDTSEKRVQKTAKTEQVVEAPKAAPVQEAAPAQATAQPAEQAQDVAPEVDYPTLQKAVFALAGKSREAAAEVAASFGVKTFKELPQDKWAEALAAVNEKLAA